MLIRKFIKLKNGMYRIVFDDKKVDIHEDLILRYNLLVNKEITDELLIDLSRENIKYQAYDIALKELKKRLRSKKELKDILQNKGISNHHIEEVILLLNKQGYLDDQVYLDSYIHDRILMSSDGPLKIQKDLLDKGFSMNDIEPKLQRYDCVLERDKILKIIQKNLKQNKKSLVEFQLKMKQLLRRMGYHEDFILSALEGITFDDEPMYKKEYEKLYRRLSSKYSGQELEYKIQQRLYQKGFRI